MAEEPAYPQPITYDPVMMSQVMADSAAAQQQAYIDGQKQLYRFQMKQLPEDYPMIQGLRRDSEALDRQAFIDFLSNYGVDAQNAMLAANPQLARSLGYVDEMAAAAGSRTPEMTRMLDEQALTQLSLNGALSAEDMRMSDQATREAYAARGMVMSNPAVVTEVLGRDSLTRQRRSEAQAFAASREAGNRNFVQSATQIADATSAGMKILGMPTGSAQGMGNTMGFIQGVQTPDPAPAMAAGIGYYGDIQGYNANMQTSLYNSYQNNQAALQAAQIQAGAYGSSNGSNALLGAGISAAGAAASAAVSAAVCWVAREVYGPADPRWRMFRVWLLLTAPACLRRAYVRHGETVASWMRGSVLGGAVRTILRPAMNLVAQ